VARAILQDKTDEEPADPLGFELAMLVSLASVERLGALVVRQIETLAPATGRTPRQIARGLLNVTGTEIEDWEAVADDAGEPTWAAIAEHVLGEIEHDGPLDRIDKFLPAVCRAIVAGNRERLVAALAGAVSDAVRRRLRPFDDEPEQPTSDEMESEPDDDE
jgi:hypothetical protein